MELFYIIKKKEMFNKEQVKITVSPKFEYSFATMQKGVLMHLDRKYTYDIIPEELLGGLLFQGIHRPPANQSIEIEILEPATIYFFFHDTANGDYDKIFKDMKDWELCSTFPQYDINNGVHGLTMIMYKIDAKVGKYIIPPTKRKKACFNILFQQK